jgi:LysM repeat protein
VKKGKGGYKVGTWGGRPVLGWQRVKGKSSKAPSESNATETSTKSDEKSTKSEAKKSTEVYVVRPGDSLWAIAERYLGDGNRYLELARYNHISNPSLLRTGQRIRIPGAVTPKKKKKVEEPPAATPTASHTAPEVAKTSEAPHKDEPLEAELGTSKSLSDLSRKVGQYFQSLPEDSAKGTLHATLKLSGLATLGVDLDFKGRRQQGAWSLQIQGKARLSKILFWSFGRGGISFSGTLNLKGNGERESYKLLSLHLLPFTV